MDLKFLVVSSASLPLKKVSKKMFVEPSIVLQNLTSYSPEITSIEARFMLSERGHLAIATSYSALRGSVGGTGPISYVPVAQEFVPLTCLTSFFKSLSKSGLLVVSTLGDLS